MSASTSSQSNVTSKRPEGWYNFCPHCSLRYWVRSADMSKPRMTRYTGEDCQTKHECPPDTVKKHRKVDPTVGAIYAKESEVPMSDPNTETIAEVEIEPVEVIADEEDELDATSIEPTDIDQATEAEVETPTAAEDETPAKRERTKRGQGVAPEAKEGEAPKRGRQGRWTPEEDALLLELNPTLTQIKTDVAFRLDRGWNSVYLHLLDLRKAQVAETAAV